ncbi:MAG: hypothetical protein JNL05_15055 [Flavobacteriales bacterium]|nr:hypothetical protein [Flavobacteriales bacterium]
MRIPPCFAFVLCLLVLPAVEGHAQSGTQVERLSMDLCGCVEAIDRQGSDERISRALKSCLEDAVVTHPAAVTAVLQGGPTQGSKAYELGRRLGALLGRDCPGYGLLRLRLREIHDQAARPKGTT